MINRRNLCQVLASLALAGLSSQFQKLAAAKKHSGPTSRTRPGRVQKDGREKLIVCIAKRHAPYEPVTFLRAPHYTNHFDSNI